MKLVGTDLSRFQREMMVESLVISPAERYIVEVRFPAAGTYALLNQVQVVDHMRGTFYAAVDTLGAVVVEGPAVEESDALLSSHSIMRTLRDITGRDSDPADTGDPADAPENAEIDWRFRLGDVVKIRLRNDTDAFHPMHHPIHLHGQRFLVLSRDGVPNRNLAWKDTVLVPVGSTVDLLMEASNPGEWMIHCHIAEHLDAGMMGSFTVVP